MKYALVLNGCAGGPSPQLREMQGFLAQSGFRGAEGCTVLFHSSDEQKRALLPLVPTSGVILVRVARYQPEQALASLEQLASQIQAELYLFLDDLAGRELPVRLACRLGGTSLIGAASAVPGPDGVRCTKAIYASHVAATFLLKRSPCCLCIAKGSAEPMAAAGEPAVLMELDRSGDAPGGWIERAEVTDAPAPAGLEQARFILATGRGAGNRERTGRLAAIAQELGAAFAVSRPVAMNAWAPLDRLVGVSGAMTRPGLCIVAGASGSAAFMAGIEKSRCIVALNLDPKAPVLGCCDLGAVGDCLPILEELARLVREARPDGGRP
jgi:electron transfer flavoprotein alpha subunit